MADRFPLILNTSTNQIQEIASGDQLDLSGNNIANAGIITAGNVTVGAATTDLIVNGDARVTGILTVGTGSLTLNGPSNLVNVGTALTLGHTQGLQFHTQNLHSAGFEVNQINVSGVVTATTFVGALTGNPTGTLQTAAQPNITSVGTLSSLNVSGGVSIGGTLTYEDVTNIDSVGIITARNGINLTGGNITLGDSSDGSSDDLLIFGAGSDLKIYHDSNHSYIQNATGDLFIKSNADDLVLQAADDVLIRPQNGEDGIKVIGDGGVELYHNGTKMLETTSIGLTISGDLKIIDNENLRLGTDNDMLLYHTGSHGYIENATGNMYIRGGGGQILMRANSAEDGIVIKPNGSVELYYDNAKTLETTVNALHLFGNTAECNIDFKVSNGNRVGFIGVTNTGRIQIEGAAGGGSKEIYFQGNLNGSTKLFHDNSVKIETTTTGFKTQGAGQVAALIGSTDAGGAILFLDGDANGDASGGDYAWLRHKTTGAVELGNNLNNSIDFLTNSTNRWYIYDAGHFIPAANNTYDIGSTSYRVRNIYTNDLNLSNEGSKNDVDGTWGNYTIQEGESDLFLINKRSGKKYKFNLTEVS